LWNGADWNLRNIQARTVPGSNSSSYTGNTEQMKNLIDNMVLVMNLLRNILQFANNILNLVNRIVFKLDELLSRPVVKVKQSSEMEVIVHNEVVNDTERFGAISNSTNPFSAREVVISNNTKSSSAREGVISNNTTPLRVLHSTQLRLTSSGNQRLFTPVSGQSSTQRSNLSRTYILEGNGQVLSDMIKVWYDYGLCNGNFGNHPTCSKKSYLGMQTKLTQAMCYALLHVATKEQRDGINVSYCY
jgi:hypothetical protein